MPTVRLPYKPRGGARELFQCRDAEILVEGGAGTGKTRAVLELANYFCVMFPGVRGLFLRMTRASLSESVLPTWETKVLWDGHPAISGKANIENRRSYTYPRASNTVKGVTYSGRSHIAIAGLDKPSRTFSQEYDFVMLFEAIEVVDLGTWELLLRCCRNWKMPSQLAIAETNPGPKNAWMNQRASIPYVVPPELADVLPPARPGQTMMTRILSRHEDNPEMWDEVTKRPTLKGGAYLGNLHRMSGPRKERMLYHRWITQSGLIWPVDPAIHYVYGVRESSSPVPDLPCHRRDRAGKLIVDWYFGVVDWGHNAPGVIQIWGVDDVRFAAYRMAEVYYSKQSLAWWSERLAELDLEFKLRTLVCDPSRPELMELFNRVLVDRERGHTPEPSGQVLKAVNDWEAGVQAVLMLLQPAADGYPRMFFVRDPLRWGRDPELVESLKPVCTEQELEGWVWKEDEMGKPVKEEPMKGLPDHGADCVRYGGMYMQLLAQSPIAEDLEQVPPFEFGSAGDVLGHAAVWAKIRGEG